MPSPPARERLRGNELIRRLRELDLDPDEFVIFGSAPLFAHGLRADIRDLDIVATGRTWERVVAIGEAAVGAISGDPVTQFYGGRIQFSQRWIPPADTAEELIRRAEVIDGLRYADLRDVLAYKLDLRRPKDVVDICAFWESADREVLG
ncbi:hypothetical protein [Actinokineospora sp. NBRC 105648]|uniref:hypothetical protein n=1 Tax=Actinokineospora sp. NBRC 105648 TaxID=3032206 RepID=UPI0024A48F44|nr:hypothetical protein [Actinokineospora sp. NBRC 105648]GLZ40678.1 hypothetical protein Acsp05_43020 [Actinokineospora sp. NBRC 105648]